MWHGGARAIVFKDEKLLMVRQIHEGREIWMVPGGAIEEGEDSREGAAREVLEETGLIVEIGALLWHRQEVSARGQRFVDFFLGDVVGGELAQGTDPELSQQVIDEVKFVSREEMEGLDSVYPEALRKEIWQEGLDREEVRRSIRDPFRKR